MCKICTQKRCAREEDKETTCKRRDVIHHEKFSKVSKPQGSVMGYGKAHGILGEDPQQSLVRGNEAAGFIGSLTHLLMNWGWEGVFPLL